MPTAEELEETLYLDAYELDKLAKMQRAAEIMDAEEADDGNEIPASELGE